MENRYRDLGWHSRSRLAVLVLSLLVIVPVGCDTVTDTGEDTIVLTHTATDLRFSINGSDLEDGTGTVAADERIDLGPFLQDPQRGGGFSKMDVESAEVESIELELISPPSSLGLIRNATLSFESGDLVQQLVAERSFGADFDEGQVTLSPDDGDVTRYVRQPDFGANLTIDVRNPQPDDIYTLAADVELRLEVANN